MEKKERKIALALCFFALAIGFFLAIQIQTPGKSMKLYTSSKTLTDLKANIQGEEQNGDNLRQRLKETELRIEEFGRMMEEDESEELLESNRAIARYYRDISGASAMRGPGVEVIIDDSARELYQWEDVNDVMVHDSDILLILNDLFAAGAEAVSLNGHRIVSTSAVSCGGYIVHVNGVPEAKPFRIEAIGDPAALSSAMLSPNSYGAYIKDSVKFQVSVKEEIEVPAYSDGSVTHHLYMSVSKEGDGEEGKQ